MRQTKALIMAAFAQLLEERSMNKITVKDIVERCDINRNTFYYHFPDIPSLLEEMMDEKINLLISQHYTPGCPFDCIKPALQYGAAHRQAILHVYRAVPRETFLVYLDRFARHMVAEYFANISKSFTVPPEDIEVLSRYYKCTVVGSLLDWLDASMRYNLESDMERICYLLEGTGECAVQRSMQQSEKI